LGGKKKREESDPSLKTRTKGGGGKRSPPKSGAQKRNWFAFHNGEKDEKRSFVHYLSREKEERSQRQKKRSVQSTMEREKEGKRFSTRPSGKKKKKPSTEKGRKDRLGSVVRAKKKNKGGKLFDQMVWGREEKTKRKNSRPSEMWEKGGVLDFLRPLEERGRKRQGGEWVAAATVIEAAKKTAKHGGLP